MINKAKITILSLGIVASAYFFLNRNEKHQTKRKQDVAVKSIEVKPEGQLRPKVNNNFLEYDLNISGFANADKSERASIDYKFYVALGGNTQFFTMIEKGKKHLPLSVFSKRALKVVFTPKGISIIDIGDLSEKSYAKRFNLRQVVAKYFFPNCLKPNQKLPMGDADGVLTYKCILEKSDQYLSSIYTFVIDEKRKLYESRTVKIDRDKNSSLVNYLHFEQHMFTEGKKTEGHIIYELKLTNQSYHNNFAQLQHLHGVPLDNLYSYPKKTIDPKKALAEALSKDDYITIARLLRANPDLEPQFIDSINDDMNSDSNLRKLNTLVNSNSPKATSFINTLYSSLPPSKKPELQKMLNFATGDVDNELINTLLSEFSSLQDFGTDKVNLGFTLASIYERTSSQAIIQTLENAWVSSNGNLTEATNVLRIVSNTGVQTYEKYYNDAVNSQSHMLGMHAVDLLSKFNDPYSADMLKQAANHSKEHIKVQAYKVMQSRSDRHLFLEEIEECKSGEFMQQACPN